MSDEATRIRAFRRSLEEAAAERLVPFARGLGIFSPSLAPVYDMNYLRVDAGAGADELARDADALMESYFHRKVEVDHGGDALAPRFGELGWGMTPHVVMAHRREPDRRVDTSSVREVGFDDLRAVRRAATLAQPWGDEAIGELLSEAKLRVAAARPMRHFAAFVGDTVAAYCELRSDGRVAQIEDVNTVVELRGRGLGRALVQHAALEARRTHELVYLEALEHDWPRELYAKLGFDVVDRRHLFLRPPHPLTALRLRTPRLVLRLGTRAELRALADVARAGVHPPDEMPFVVPWTDNAAQPEFVDDFVAFHESRVRDWSADDWSLNLLAFHGGRVIGTQGIGAERFAERRVVSTGSWLGQAFHGRGFGTEMRAAVLALAFDGLGAEAAQSGAIDGNVASLRVSEKLGYEVVGTGTRSPRGTPVREHELRLDRERWRGADVELAGLEPLLPLFGVT